MNTILDFIFGEPFLSIWYAVIIGWFGYRLARYTKGLTFIVCSAMWVLLARGSWLVKLPRAYDQDDIANVANSGPVQVLCFAVASVLLGYATVRRWKATHGDVKAQKQIDSEAEYFEPKKKESEIDE